MGSDREEILFRTALTYANGYRELGMFDHALEELENLEAEYGADRMLNQMRLAILMEANRWREALPFANILASHETTDPGNLVNLAYVTRRAEDINQARVILEVAARKFPGEAIIQYNLGCYAACSGDLDTAKEYLRSAYKLDAQYIEMSEGDDDLKALRPWISEFVKPDSELT